MKEFLINEKNKSIRLDKYLLKILPSAEKGFIYKMLRKKNITLNDSKAVGNEILKVNDRIKIFFSDDTFNKFSKNNFLNHSSQNSIYNKAFKEIKGVKIVFENEDLIIVDKAAGIICQTDDKNSISLNEWIIGYLLNSGFTITDYKPSICNRIDLNTSGLVIGAKTYLGSRFAFDIIKNHKIKKYYLALCQGIIKDRISLKGFLKKNEINNKVTISLTDNTGDYIETIVEPVADNGEISLLKIELLTGKPHQIRGHLASINHPLCGDIKYGGKPYKGIRHQLLHSYMLEFPVSEEMNFNDSNRFIKSMPGNVFFESFDLNKDNI